MNKQNNDRQNTHPDNNPSTRGRVSPITAHRRRRTAIVAGLAATTAVVGIGGPAFLKSVVKASGNPAAATAPYLEAIKHPDTTSATVYIDPGQVTEYPAGTEILSSPADLSESGDGTSNVVLPVPDGSELRITGTVYSTVPGSGSNELFQSFSLKNKKTHETSTAYVAYSPNSVVPGTGSSQMPSSIENSGSNFVYEHDGSKVVTAVGSIVTESAHINPENS